jgi:serine/threonine-protein kinase
MHAAARPDLARYRILGPLGSGGMGDVWLARASGPAGFEKLVVVKTIRSEAASGSHAIEMFLREARVAALLSHPNCVQIFELGEEGGTYFIAMEYIDGFPLARVARRASDSGRPVPIEIAVRIGIDAAAGLHHAHELTDPAGAPLQLVHRDVSLDNLLVAFTGQTKIVDFGIAKASSALAGEQTQTGVIKGKSGYMAPEYLRGDAIDARADIFALGVVLYRVLTGEKPFTGENDAQIVARMLTFTQPPSPRSLRADVPEALDAVITRALAPDPAQRFATARDLRTALAAAIERVPDSDAVAAYLAALWPESDDERRALRKLIAGEATTPLPTGGSSTSLEAATTPLGPEPATSAATVPSDRKQRTRVSRGVLAAAIAAGIAGTAFVVHRWQREPDAPPPQAAAPVRPAHRADEPTKFLIADFTNSTGDPRFDDTFEIVLALSLEAEPTFVWYDREVALKRAGELYPGTKALDPRTARGVAAHEHVDGVITGTLTRAGTGYQIALQLVEPAGRELARAEATVDTPDHALQAIAGLAGKLAVGLGARDGTAVERAAGTFTTTTLAAMHEWAIGRTLDHRGELDAASDHYQNAIRMDPNHARAYYGYAVELMNRGRVGDADRNFQLALANLGGLTEREQLRVRSQYYMDIPGDLDRAIEELNTLVKRYPFDAVAFGNLSIAYSLRRDFVRALEVQRRANDLAPIWFGRVNFAIYEFYATREQAAIADMQLELPSQVAKLYDVVALAELVQGHADRAQAQWEALAALPFGGSDGALGLADLALHDGRITDAIAILDKGIAADHAAKNEDAAALKLVTLGHAHALLGHAAEARSALDEALRASQESNIRFWAGRGYIEIGDEHTARTIHDQIAAQLGQQRKVDALILDAELLLAQRKPKDAIDRLEQARGVLDTWLGRLDLARAYIAAGAFAQASSEADVLIRRLGEGGAALVDEQPTGYLLPQPFYYRGRALEGLGDPAAADAYRQVLQRMSADPPRDPLAIDAKKRLKALESAAARDRSSRPTP